MAQRPVDVIVGARLAALRTARGMSETWRQEAVTVAQTYAEDPQALNNLAWELVKAYLGAEFSRAERHVRRLGKVAALESRA